MFRGRAQLKQWSMEVGVGYSTRFSAAMMVGEILALEQVTNGVVKREAEGFAARMRQLCNEAIHFP